MPELERFAIHAHRGHVHTEPFARVTLVSKIEPDLRHSRSKQAHAYLRFAGDPVTGVAQRQRKAIVLHIHRLALIRIGAQWCTQQCKASQRDSCGFLMEALFGMHVLCSWGRSHVSRKTRQPEVVGQVRRITERPSPSARSLHASRLRISLRFVQLRPPRTCCKLDRRIFHKRCHPRESVVVDVLRFVSHLMVVHVFTA